MKMVKNFLIFFVTAVMFCCITTNGYSNIPSVMNIKKHHQINNIKNKLLGIDCQCAPKQPLSASLTPPEDKTLGLNKDISEQLDADALFAEGKAYEYGKDRPKNPQLALLHYRLAALKGKKSAQEAVLSVLEKCSPKMIDTNYAQNIS
jgi:hypothetical protein